jgi:HD-GYP domain-containing protein (c-di-GMP phosphodiesterase class II)/DNA-binding CsgD family transcriptional regulator
MAHAMDPAMTDPGREVLACLRGLSIVLDLANGLREDKSLATALFAHAIAVRLGATEKVRADAFLAALLRHLGCTSYAHQEATFVEDDVLLRRALATSDSSDPAELARAFVLANPTTDPSGTLARLAESGPEQRLAWTSEACGGARLLATSMGFGEDVSGALDEVFERYDGRGGPRGRAGEGISLIARIGQVAHVAVSHHAERGQAAARAALVGEQTSGHACDPAMARIALDVLDEHPDALLAGADERLRAITPGIAAHTPNVGAAVIAEAFGDFADLQSQHTRGHARGVAKLVSVGATRLGLTPSERHAVILAAHLHDVGAAAVPTRIWETRDVWSEAARERARMHVYYTERVLSLAAPFHAAAPIAGAHHERLDAAGYHRGIGAERIPIGARLLAAADVLHALREDRPHRAALTRSAAKERVVLLAKEGALDARAVEAAIAPPGAPAREVDGLASLTARERDVLRHVAHGKTNKEIASSLGISDRTVQSHTLNVYEKLGVTTRAAAAILASRAGLLDRS